MGPVGDEGAVAPYVMPVRAGAAQSSKNGGAGGVAKPEDLEKNSRSFIMQLDHTMWRTLVAESQRPRGSSQQRPETAITQSQIANYEKSKEKKKASKAAEGGD